MFRSNHSLSERDRVAMIVVRAKPTAMCILESTCIINELIQKNNETEQKPVKDRSMVLDSSCLWLCLLLNQSKAGGQSMVPRRSVLTRLPYLFFWSTSACRGRRWANYAYCIPLPSLQRRVMKPPLKERCPRQVAAGLFQRASGKTWPVGVFNWLYVWWVWLKDVEGITIHIL